MTGWPPPNQVQQLHLAAPHLTCINSSQVQLVQVLPPLPPYARAHGVRAICTSCTYCTQEGIPL
jgi:hypothetical protein